MIITYSLASVWLFLAQLTSHGVVLSLSVLISRWFAVLTYALTYFDKVCNVYLLILYVE